MRRSRGAGHSAQAQPGVDPGDPMLIAKPKESVRGGPAASVARSFAGGHAPIVAGRTALPITAPTGRVVRPWTK